MTPKQYLLIGLLSIPMPMFSNGTSYDHTDIAIALGIATIGLCTVSFLVGADCFAKQNKRLKKQIEFLRNKMNLFQQRANIHNSQAILANQQVAHLLQMASRSRTIVEKTDTETQTDQ